MDGVYDYISLTICIATVVANVVLNVGILIAPCIDRALRSKRFAVLISLAVADLLKIISLVSEIGSPLKQLKTCQAIASIGLYLICVTVLHLVLESINRLVTIVRPLRYNELLTTKLVVSLIAVMWILPILGIILPYAFYSDEIDWMPSFRVLMFNCDEFYDKPASGNLTTTLSGIEEEAILIHSEPVDTSVVAYSAFITIVYFAIPLIVMVLSYSVIFNISLKHIKQIKSMEENVRHLYHRISRSNIIVTQVSRTSSPTQGLENDDYESRSPYRASTEPVAFHAMPSNVETNGETGSICGHGIDTFEGKSSKVTKIDYHPINWTESSPAENEACGITNTHKVTKAKPVYDGSAPKSTDTKVEGRRKASNIVHPQNSSVEIAWDANISTEKLEDEYKGLSKRSEEEIVYNGKIDGARASLDTLSELRYSIIPVQAADVMATEYESVLARNILLMDTAEVDDLKQKDKELNDTAALGPLKADNADSGHAVYKVAQVKNETGGDFLEDIGENKSKTLWKTRINSHLRSVIDEPLEVTKHTTWSKLWQRVAKRSETIDRKNEDVDRILTEDAFMKIIDLVEKKSRRAPHRFEENARRVMRYSGLVTSHRRKRTEEEDEDIGERPTHAEVNQMESLLSIAKSRENDQIAKALNKTISSSSSANEDQTIDAFSLLTAFPAMEAWAQSLKARAAPNSNSFVRFYRVIRREMRNRKKEGKLVKTLGILFMAWILFYVPVIAFSWKRLMRWPSVIENDDGIGRLLFSWALLSSAFNPIIYSLRIPEFKKTLKNIYKTIKLHIYCK